jgi:hypothetical protein
VKQGNQRSRKENVKQRSREAWKAEKQETQKAGKAKKQKIREAAKHRTKNQKKQNLPRKKNKTKQKKIALLSFRICGIGILHCGLVNLPINHFLSKPGPIQMTCWVQGMSLQVCSDLFSTPSPFWPTERWVTEILLTHQHLQHRIKMIHKVKSMVVAYPTRSTRNSSCSCRPPSHCQAKLSFEPPTLSK